MPIYEPEPSSFGDDRRPTNVLWGRIVALAVVLLLVFTIGRATAGGGSSEEVADLQARIASRDAEIDQLDRQVRAAQTTSTIPGDPAAPGAETTTPDGAEANGPGGAGATTTTAPSGGATTTTLSTEDEIYTVLSGDTLQGIASKIYGRTSLHTCISKAQTPPITDTTSIRPGQKLIIPRPAPTEAC